MILIRSNSSINRTYLFYLKMNVKNIHRFVFWTLVIHGLIWYLRPTFRHDMGGLK